MLAKIKKRWYRNRDPIRFLKKRNGKDNTKLPFMTAKDLADSGLAGTWKDRKDIRSTAQFSRKLRKRLSKGSSACL
jgi:hypothetical protein